MDKKSQRQAMLLARNSLDETEISAHSVQVASHLAELKLLQNKKMIFAYLARGSEINLQSFIELCWQRGINVAVPVCSGQPYGIMQAALYDRKTRLTAASFGILEPVMPQFIAPSDIDAVLAPGVAFAGNGARLGYGGGYYDKFLSQLSPAVLRIGIAHEMQLLPHIATARHDLPMHMLCTEKRLFSCDVR